MPIAGMVLVLNDASRMGDEVSTGDPPEVWDDVEFVDTDFVPILPTSNHSLIVVHGPSSATATKKFRERLPDSNELFNSSRE